MEFGAKGVRLTKDNTLDGVTVLTTDDEVAILNGTVVPELGTLTLRDVTARGQVLLVADDQVRVGHIQIADLHVRSADVRGRALRPHGLGVEALQGSLTIWNRQADPAVRITAEVLDVSVGTEEARCAAAVCSWEAMGTGRQGRPRCARGLAASDRGDLHGWRHPGRHAGPDLRRRLRHLGARVEQVTMAGVVTTYGQNDIVLDNGGTVTTWTATGPVTLHGPSGIGFVNFGDVERIEIGGRLATSGDNVVTLEIEGALSTLGVPGGIHATGRGSDAAHATAGAPDPTNIEITAAHGEELMRT